jgi:uroporphyrin-3 C-methyltransferase
MTEKKQNQPKTPANTPQQTPAAPATDKPVLQKQSASRSKSSNTKARPTNQGTALSKIGILALVLSLAAITSIGGLYYWQNLQQGTNTQQILQHTQQNHQSLAAYQQEIKQLLQSQQQQNIVQLQSLKGQLQNQQQDQILQLETKLARLSQKQPNDWLIQESEYLLRIAVRSLWFERDVNASLALLREADGRLKKLDDASFLPVRQAIAQDIQALQLMPVIDSEALLLTLMAMNKQVNTLVLSFEYLPAATQVQSNLELSTSVDDWQSNLKKTWLIFSADFLSVRDRTTPIEPLLSPQYQQNLIQNLSLKLQLAQWAVSQQQAELFKQVLQDTETWLSDYFAKDKQVNISFLEQLRSLKDVPVSFDYPSNLSSLQALSLAQLNNQQNSNIQPEPQAPAQAAPEKQQTDIQPEAQVQTEVI